MGISGDFRKELPPETYSKLPRNPFGVITLFLVKKLFATDNKKRKANLDYLIQLRKKSFVNRSTTVSQ